MTARSSFLNYLRPGARCVFQAGWCPTPTIRKVVTVLTKKVSFSHPKRDSESWLDFPKADEIREPVPGRFVIGPADALVYDFRLEALAAPGVLEPENSK